MKKIIIFLLLSIPMLIHAQENAGIQFAKEPHWKAVLDKAKAEHKFVFVDFYTTWCGPCKRMDSLIYKDKNVGDVYNARFISVKVQMDKTEKDDSMVRKWYKQADILGSQYAINAYPSLLFFSSDGTPLHKVIGYQDASQFIAIAEEAQDPSKQFYTVAKNFKPGQLDTSEMRGLVNIYYPMDKQLAGKIAADYLNRQPASEMSKQSLVSFMKQYSSLPEVAEVVLGYTNRLPKKQLYTQDNLELLSLITKSTENRGFKIFYNNSAKVDALVHKKGFAQRTSDNIIYTSEVYSYLQSMVADTLNNKVPSPDFDQIETSISKKYDKSAAGRIILSAKIKWYGYVTRKYNTHWSEYCQYFMAQVAKDGPDSTVRKMNGFVLNNILFDAVFKHSNNVNQLNLAGACMKIIVDQTPPGQIKGGLMDTYANLLYKAGKREEALALQIKAVELTINPKTGKSNGSIQTALEKMKKNEPTWPVEEKPKKGF